MKNPAHPPAHGHQGAAVDGRLEPEPEQPRVALAEELVDGDVIADHLADHGKLVVEGHHRVEEPVDGQPSGLEVDAQVGREEQVGLPRLDGDAGGNPPGVEIPGPGQDVVLGDDPAAGHRPRDALDLEDPVDQHQRFVGEPDPGRMLVNLGELGPEDVADPPDGEFEALVAVEEEGRPGCGRGRNRRGPTRAGGLLDQLHLERQLTAHHLRQPARVPEVGAVGPARGPIGGEELAAERVGDVDGGEHGGGVRRGVVCPIVIERNRRRRLELGRCPALGRPWGREHRGDRERSAADLDADRPGRGHRRGPSLLLRIERRQVDRESLGDQPPQRHQIRGDRRTLSGARGDGQMRPAFEDLADHPGAGASRTDLDEGPDAVVVGPADHLREIDPMQGMGQDRPGRRLAIDRVPLPGRPAVESDAPGGCRGQEVEVVVGAFDGPDHLAMHRADQRERMEPSAHLGQQPLDGRSMAPDDDLPIGVDDQQISPVDPPEGVEDPVGGALDDAGDPVDRLPLGKAPGSPGGVAGAGEVGPEEGRLASNRRNIVSRSVQAPSENSAVVSPRL